MARSLEKTPKMASNISELLHSVMRKRTGSVKITDLLRPSKITKKQGKKPYPSEIAPVAL
jgi:hypothetical protein